MAWFATALSFREVEVSLSKREVRVQTLDLLFRRKLKMFPLDSFDKVISYRVPGETPMNLLELVTRAGGESLLLVELPPQRISSWYSISFQYRENPEITLLREALVQTLGFIDKGYVNSRLPGARI
ncbi:MAG: hypothetical protein RLZZ271_1123 [Pseudomonadota bacterium]|jgi:hypothetical protein